MTKIIKYEEKEGMCQHIRGTIGWEREMCNLTKYACVGYNINPENSKVENFYQERMRRCPLYNLDFKPFLGKNISDKIEEVRVGEEKNLSKREMELRHKIEGNQSQINMVKRDLTRENKKLARELEGLLKQK